MDPTSAFTFLLGSLVGIIATIALAIILGYVIWQKGNR